MDQKHYIGQPSVYRLLHQLQIDYKYYESPVDFVDEDDLNFWNRTGATRCKNLFLRNHKGDKHFLIIAPFYENVSIMMLEKYFNKGKISFASDDRLMKHLGVSSGAVSVFGLLNNALHMVEVFVDDRLYNYKTVSFLPNQKGAIITFEYSDLIKLVEYLGNRLTILKLSE